MNTLAIIFSYNRDKPLLKTLKELHGHYNLIVIDDGSEYDYSEHSKYCNYIRYPHTGKKEFWIKWNTAFKLCRSTEHERFIFLPDDYENYDIERINSTFNLMGDKFACNVTNVGWEQSWTPIKKQPCGIEGFWRVGFIDHGTITTRKVLEALNFEVKRVSNTHFRKNTSSGVGKQISTRLYRLEIPMYKPVKSMASMQDIESQMNKEERKRNPNRAI